MPGPVRVGVIGSSGKGDYGHGLDAAFQDLEGATLVAVADDNPAGRERVASRLGVDRSYADYGRMLKREKLDVVCVGPRWHNERVAMVTAAAEAGCHIYFEKPFAPTVEVNAPQEDIRFCQRSRLKTTFFVFVSNKGIDGMLSPA